MIQHTNVSGNAIALAHECIIETDRLYFRPFQFSDLEALAFFYTDEEVMKFIGKGARTFAEVEQELRGFIEDYQTYGFGSCAVIEKASGKLIGRSGIRVSDRFPFPELGYVFRKDGYWGKGYGSEAAKACLQLGFNLKFQRLVAFVQPGNIPSQRILLKVGMQCENPNFQYGEKTYLQFGLSRDSYLSRQVI